ncbi:hypothetical protein FQZ97_1079210 [compost metagenome]
MLCAEWLSISASINTRVRSGELANCSLVLFAACCASTSDSSSFSRWLFSQDSLSPSVVSAPNNSFTFSTIWLR